MIQARSVSKTFHVREDSPRELKERAMSWLRRERRILRSIDAVCDVSLNVGAGEAVALIGNNGAGKSTFLRCLAGILQPSSGTVLLAGRPTALLDLGAGFHPELSGMENIFLHASLHGISRREILPKIDAIVRFSELQDFIHLPLKVYSAGMTLRLGFAIAVHLDADIMLVDESLSVGDHDFQRKCLARMKELREAGVAVVLATHDFTTAETFCSRAILLHDGRRVEEGEPASVCRRYEESYAGASSRFGDIGAHRADAVSAGAG